MPAIIQDSEIVLYGTVGDMFWEDSFTARDVVAALSQLKNKDISVRLNSGGGIADEGVAIYNSLKAHAGKVTVFVDGIAASAASIIAMAGSKVVMRTGSVMMIHDPLMLAMGNAGDMDKAKEALNAIGDSMADIYAAKTGRKAADIRAEMRDELWLTPKEAKAKGFADDEEEAEEIEASAFDYRAYSRPPERILALSDSRAWSNRLRGKPKATTERKQPMAGNMTEEAAAALAETKSKEAAETAQKAEAKRAGDIVAICTEAGTPALAAKLISEGKTVDEAKAAATAEGARVVGIKQKVEAARKSCPQIDAAMIDKFIKAGTSVETAGNELLDLIVAAQTVQINNKHGMEGGTGEQKAVKLDSPSAIYARRAKARADMAIGE
jgi:ATP-dependent Clp protease protease subunit